MSAINDAASNIPLDDASAFPNAGAVQINDEIITYRRKDHNTLRGAVRGADGTAAVPHAGGSIVSAVVIPPTPLPPVQQPQIYQAIGQGAGCAIGSRQGGGMPAVLLGIALAAWAFRKRFRG